jgi:hypothetical protein
MLDPHLETTRYFPVLPQLTLEQARPLIGVVIARAQILKRHGAPKTIDAVISHPLVQKSRQANATKTNCTNTHWFPRRISDQCETCSLLR